MVYLNREWLGALETRLLGANTCLQILLFCRNLAALLAPDAAARLQVFRFNGLLVGVGGGIEFDGLVQALVSVGRGVPEILAVNEFLRAD